MTGRLIMEAIAAFAGTIAFALLFHAPAKFYPYCGMIGMIGWIEYRLLNLFCGCSVMAATFLAGVTITFLSRYYAVREACPVTVFLIAGIFPLVPGGGVYWTAYYIVTNDFSLAGQRGFLTLKIAVAIVLSIILVFECPQKWIRRITGKKGKL